MFCRDSLSFTAKNSVNSTPTNYVTNFFNLFLAFPLNLISNWVAKPKKIEYKLDLKLKPIIHNVKFMTETQ